jgi:uncharacterized membrane protein
VKSASGPLRPYQVLATIVGLNLIFVFTAAIAQRATDDTSWWNQHEGLILAIDQVHGLLFMILLVQQVGAVVHDLHDAAGHDPLRQLLGRAPHDPQGARLHSCLRLLVSQEDPESFRG